MKINGMENVSWEGKEEEKKSSYMSLGKEIYVLLWVTSSLMIFKLAWGISGWDMMNVVNRKFLSRVQFPDLIFVMSFERM